MIFNANPFNTSLYGGSFGITTPSTDLAVFDGFSLADNVNTITQNLIDSGPSTEFLDGPVPRGHGMYLNGRFFRQKVIEVRGIVKHTTGPLLDAYLETMKKSLAGQEQFLDITRGNVVRRYVATVDNFDEMFSEREGYHITVCPFTVRFRILTPFATDRDYTSISETVTSSPHNITYENTGTYDADIVGVLNFSAANSITAVQLSNLTTGVSISYTGSIAAGTLVRFDTETKTVTVNGVAVNYSGAFPILEAGSNLMRWTVTGTSFTALSTLKSKQAYL